MMHKCTHALLKFFDLIAATCNLNRFFEPRIEIMEDNLAVELPSDPSSGGEGFLALCADPNNPGSLANAASTIVKQLCRTTLFLVLVCLK